MTPTTPHEPPLPELIRHTHALANTPGPEQDEARRLLESFGFDANVPAATLTDDYVFAVLDRAAQSHTH